ncbi:MAG: hypothetical protein AAGP08_03550 [Pseudomonadota bacterium]
MSAAPHQVTPLDKRRTLHALFGLAMLILGALHIFAAPFPNPLVSASEDTAEEIAVSTAAVYVSLRAINAALSTAQEVEIGVSVGVGGGFQPLKVLEPVDDTVERVSEAVFIIASLAAIALVGLGPVVGLGFLALGIGVIAAVICATSPSLAPWHSFCTRLARIGFVLALVFPLAFSAGVWFGERATQNQWDAAIIVLNEVAQEAQFLIRRDTDDDPAPTATGTGGGIVGFIRGLGDSVTETTEAAKRYRDAAGVFFSKADALLSASLTIVGIFILRMILLPALLLWLAASVIRTNARK